MSEIAYDFLTWEDILAIHEEQLALHGGLEGVLDRGAIESCLAQAQWALQYGGDIADMAAAYLYHFAVNQGFVDGNKRAAVVAAIEFLGRNGYLLDRDDLEMYSVTMQIANKQTDKETVGDWFRQRLRPMPD
jgi:death-on-curing protein